MELLIKSTIDSSSQPSLFFKAEDENRPLLVNLHSWSFDRYNKVDTLKEYCKKYNWNLLLPNFRGSNCPDNPEVTKACGSVEARQDIIDAVNYVCQNYNIDQNAILLLGASGGGHMSLMMCGYAPNMWRAAMAWVPITDLAKWFEQKRGTGASAKYCDDMLAVFGSEPKDDPKSYLERSPVNYIDQIAKSRLYICHGLYDTSVNVRHSIEFYSELQKNHPDSQVYLNIFDGKHEINYDDAFRWLNRELGDKIELSEVTR